jgi:hypothetical protein
VKKRRPKQKHGPKPWPRRTVTEEAPGVTREVVRDGLFTAEVQRLAAETAPLTDPTPDPFPPVGLTMRETVARLKTLYGGLLTGGRKRRPFRFAGTAADGLLWREMTQHCLDRANALEAALAAGDPDRAAEAGFLAGWRACAWYLRALHMEAMRKARNSAEARPTREEGPAWRAVRLALRKRPEAEAKELLPVFEKAGGRLTAQRFAEGLTRHRRRW